MSDMTPPLLARLRSPARRISLMELAGEWHQQTIEITLEGFADFAKSEKLLPFVRRAWGAKLTRGASQEALDERPCPWLPPCALDVFFREQMRIGRHGLPKPYVFSASPDGQDLIVCLTIFGFATEWLPAAVERVVEALRDTVSWHQIDKSAYLPTFSIASVRIATYDGLELADAPSLVELDFATPADAEGEHDLLDEPHSLIGRLARRIDGLARWQDAAIEVRWGSLSEKWKSLEYWSGDLANAETKRWSGRQNRMLDNQAVRGKLVIAGELGEIWPLLVIGQHCHVGRGAVAGQGRFRLSQIEVDPHLQTI
jgi:CRISPR-associated endoribonuclease Cas6